MYLTAESPSTFNATRTGLVYAKRSLKTSIPLKLYPLTYFTHRKWWHDRVGTESKKMRLSRTVDSYKQELLKLKEAAHVSSFIEVTSDAEKGNLKALLLIVDQVKNCKNERRRRGQKPCWDTASYSEICQQRRISICARITYWGYPAIRPCRSTSARFEEKLGLLS